MSPELKEIIEDIARDLRPLVKEIEANHATTQGHYGRYMSIISALSHNSPRMGKLVALALIEAGANLHGVQSALRVSF